MGVGVGVGETPAAPVAERLEPLLGLPVPAALPVPVPVALGEGARRAEGAWPRARRPWDREGVGGAISVALAVGVGEPVPVPLPVGLPVERPEGVALGADSVALALLEREGAGLPEGEAPTDREGVGDLGGVALPLRVVLGAGPAMPVPEAVGEAVAMGQGDRGGGASAVRPRQPPLPLPSDHRPRACAPCSR